MESLASFAFLIGSPIFFAYGMRKKLYNQVVGASIFILVYVLTGLFITMTRPNEGAFLNSVIENILVTFVWGVVAGCVILLFASRSFRKGLKEHNEKEAAKQTIYVKRCLDCGYNEEFHTKPSSKCPNCGGRTIVSKRKV